jgi:hypothetical protein
MHITKKTPQDMEENKESPRKKNQTEILEIKKFLKSNKICSWKPIQETETSRRKILGLKDNIY